MQIDRKKSRGIELWNAISMLPGFYFIYHHLTTNECMLQRLGLYSYGFLCLVSMHCHLYRITCSYTEAESRRYMRFLRMDLVAQSVCIAINAYYTPLGVYGVVWAVAGVGLDIYNTHAERGLNEYIQRKDLWLRPIHEGILISMLTWHFPESLHFFIQSFVCFALSKVGWWPLDIFHGVFHILTHDAMNALWHAQKVYPVEFVVYPWVAECITGMAAVLLLYTVVQCYGKAWKYFDRVLTSIYFTVIGVWAYVGYYDSTKHFTYVPFVSLAFLPKFQILSELCYYIAAASIEIYEREWILLAHHVLAFSVIYFASYFGFAHLLIWCLAIFMPTNVPLTLSKWGRAAGQDTLARWSFGAFTILYGVLRMGGLSHFVYKTVIEAYSLEHIPSTIYIGMNGMILFLYALHWYWLGKIVQLWKRILSNASVKKIK